MLDRLEDAVLVEVEAEERDDVLGVVPREELIDDERVLVTNPADDAIVLELDEVDVRDVKESEELKLVTIRLLVKADVVAFNLCEDDVDTVDLDVNKLVENELVEFARKDDEVDVYGLVEFGLMDDEVEESELIDVGMFEPVEVVVN